MKAELEFHSEDVGICWEEKWEEEEEEEDWFEGSVESRVGESRTACMNERDRESH